MNQCLILGSSELATVPTGPQAVTAKTYHGHSIPSSRAVILFPHTRFCSIEGNTEVLQAPSRTPCLSLQCAWGHFVSKYSCCNPCAVWILTSSSPYMKCTWPWPSACATAVTGQSNPERSYFFYHGVMRAAVNAVDREAMEMSVVCTAVDHVPHISRISCKQIKD